MFSTGAFLMKFVLHLIHLIGSDSVRLASAEVGQYDTETKSYESQFTIKGKKITKRVLLHFKDSEEPLLYSLGRGYHSTSIVCGKKKNPNKISLLNFFHGLLTKYSYCVASSPDSDMSGWIYSSFGRHALSVFTSLFHSQSQCLRKGNTTSLSSEICLDDFPFMYVCDCISCAPSACARVLLVSQGRSKGKNAAVERNAGLISAAYL